MFHHVPVLLQQCIEALQPRDGGVYVDCTLGGGGHTEALLAAADTRVIGIDRDPSALAAATERNAGAGDRFTPVRGSFGDLGLHLDALGIERVDGILADLGVSSHQLDTAERGFSFRFSGPIDMRMDPSAPLTAGDIVNRWDQTELADLLYRFGEERRSRRIAAAIVAGRPWSDTSELAACIAGVMGRGKNRIHPATRSFQALRIAVNGELDQLESLLEQSIHRLQPDGRLALISFHSLEDRIVKHFLAKAAGKNAPRDGFGNPIGPVHVQLFPSVVPSEDDPNPRARSARLRSARRLPWNAP